MRRFLLATSILSITLTAYVARGEAQSLVIATQTGEPSLEALPNVPVQIWIQVRQATEVGGAEFKLAGLPTAWLTGYTTHPATTAALGNPFGLTGINMSFAECQTNIPLTLLTVTITATTAVDDVVLQVTHRTPPTNPGFECPLITLCDNPAFTKVCVAGSALCINSVNVHCSDAVIQRTWSAIKDIYR